MSFPVAPSGTPQMQAKPMDLFLFGKVLLAFDASCEQDKLEVAGTLLDVAEAIVGRASDTPERRRSKQVLLAAYERLWQLRHLDLAA